MNNKTYFYVDGSSQGNPGPGGYGVVGIRNNKIVYKYSEYFDKTTNNRMELKAILHILTIAYNNPKNEYVVYSDSSYAIQSVTNWIHSWANNGWKNSKKKTVENLDIMLEIYPLIRFPVANVSIIKVPGHSGIAGNELADALATKNIKKFNQVIEKNEMKDYS